MVHGEDIATAHRQVLTAQRVADIVEVELKCFELVEFHADLHLAFRYTPDLQLVDLRMFLDPVLQMLGIFVELLHRIIATDVDVHHRHKLAEVHLENARLGR